MTIALSIIFSAATEFAIASSSALLAEIALAISLSVLFPRFVFGFFEIFKFFVIRARQVERAGGGDQPVGQDQLGAGHLGEAEADLARLAVGEDDGVVLDPLDGAAERLPAGG